MNKQLPEYQTQLALIQHTVEDNPIDQRAIDGYINATAMCQVAGKRLANYTRLDTTRAYLETLSSVTHIRVSELLQQVRGGSPDLQGTWVHPKVAIHLAQWLSPEFSVQVTMWVFDWISGQGSRTPIPNHVRRYLVNRHKIPATHFSMLDQMTLRLLAPLEDRGYIIPIQMMPDIALGKMFSGWLRASKYKPDTFPTYAHEFLDHRPTVKARLYPNSLITEFNLQLDRWLRDGRARKYFAKLDPAALPPLDKILALPPPKPT